MSFKLTKNQRADALKMLSEEQRNLSLTLTDGTSFEEGVVVGRIQVLMELISNKPETPAPTEVRARVGNREVAVSKTP